MNRYAALLCALLGACAMNLPAMPGTITEDPSPFDGGRIVNLKPANAGTIDFSMGAQWRSSAPDTVLLIVDWLGAPLSIQDRAGLEFKADGKVIQLDSIGLPTNVSIERAGYAGYVATSSKTFAIPLGTFQGLLRAGSLKARLNTSAGGIETDMLAQDMPMTAIHGFREFAARLR